jgi:lysyl-tRNA synthetase class 1
MPLPEYVRAWLDEFDRSVEPIDLLIVAGTVSIRLNERGASHVEIDSIQKILAPAEFGIRPQGNSAWGVYFAPKHEETLEDGTRKTYPDLNSFDATTVDEWASLGEEFENPVLKAVFCDAVWELAKPLASVRKDLHRFALIAADSYLLAAKQNRYYYSIAAFEAVPRAINLALQLNSQPRIQNVIDYVVGLGNSSDPKQVTMSAALLERLLQIQRIPADSKEQVLKEFERHFNDVVAKRDLFLASIRGKALADYYFVRQGYDKAQAITKAYGELTLDLTTTMNASLAVHHISNVLEEYRRLGMRQDAERVRLLLESRGKDVPGEMKSLPFKIELDSEESRRFTESALATSDPYAALYRIAKGTAPEPDDVRAWFAKASEGSLFYRDIPISVTGDHGLSVAVLDTSDKDGEGRLMLQLARAMNIGAMFMLNSLEEWKQKFGLEDIGDTPTLYDSLLIPNDRIRFFQDGMAAYKAGDYVKTIHVLIPQVENSLRILLELLDRSPTKSNSNFDGTYEWKNMDEALHDPDVRQTLDDKLWYFLKILYTEKTGLNLRHLVAHGAASYDVFNQLNATLVVQSIVLLSAVRIGAVSLDPDVEAPE